MTLAVSLNRARSQCSSWGLPLALAVAVFLTALAAITLTRESGRIAAIWPANALVLAVVLSSPRRRQGWLVGAAFVGNAAANLISGDNLLLTILLASANSLEIAVASTLVARRGSLRLVRRSGLVRFGRAVVIGCGASTLYGQAGLALAGGGASLDSALVWLSADVLGLLIFTPLALAWIGGDFSADALQKARGTLWTFGALITVTIIVFTQSRLPLLFVPPAILAVLAISSGFASASLGVLAVSTIAVVATIMGHGPVTLVNGDDTQKVIVLQGFLATLTVISLTIGATFAERQNMTARLGRARRHAQGRAAREGHLLEQARLAERLSRVGYWTLDTRSGAVFWSPEVYAIHGVEPGTYDPALEDAMAFYVPEDRDRIRALIAEKAEQGEGWEFDAVIIRRSDGSRRDVRSMAECRKNDSGAVTGFFGVFKDLTEERRALAVAIEQQRRYRLLADNASDVIAVYGRDGVFTYLSPSVKELLGYTPEEMIGRTPYDFMLAEDQQRIADQFRTAAGSHDPLRIEYRMRTKGGDVRWFEARSRFQRDASGRIVEIHDSVRDVTERRDREVALAQATEAANAAARTKAAFLANMSHEIRTPLNGILGFADILSRSRLSKDQRRFVSRIQTSGKGLAALIDDILDFSKIESGKLEVERRAFDMEALCRDVVEVTATTAANPLAFSCSLTDEFGAPMLGDEQRVRQVLLNLLGNAAKFTSQGFVRLSGTVQGDRILVSVEDSGIGIAPEAMDRLFQDFTQADATIARRFGGTGLGLNISRSLARLMGGDVTLTSTEGVGTTAVLSLPYAPASSAAPDVQTEAPRSRPLRVLAVDDVEANLELLEVLLGEDDHDMVGATSADRALEILESDVRFDLILMDVQMPGTDGLAATRRVRALDSAASEIPIVALTANVMADQIAECRGAGMDDHLGKPFTRPALRKVLSRAARQMDQSFSDQHGDVPPSPELEALGARYREYLGTLPEKFDELLRLEPEPRRSAIASLAHSVAGTAGSFGFETVSAAAFKLEATAKAWNPDQDDQPLKIEIRSVIQALQ